MKSVYTAIIFFGILVIFSLQTFAQNGTPNGVPNGSGNGSGNGYANGTPNGYTNGSGNGYTNGSGNGYTNGSANGYTNGAATPGPVSRTLIPAPVQSSSRQYVKVVEPVDNHRQKDNSVYVRSTDPDRYGYTQNELSSIARICLVPGARRCVQ